jgi:autotransporter-associated beta strand protein
MATKDKMMNFLLMLTGMLVLAGTAQAQLTVQKQITVDKNVPDNGVLRTGFTWSNSGMSVIDSVSVTLNVSSPFASNPINLNDLSGSIRHGLSTEAFRTGSLFSAGQMTSLSQTFTQASALDGNWLPSNYWRLDLADGRGGGIAELDNFTFAVTGTASSSGTLDVGQGGVIKAATAGTQAMGGASSSGTGANAVALDAVSGATLQLNQGLSGAGDFNKQGDGVVRLSSAASGFSGTVKVNSGEVEVANSAALGSGSLSLASGAALRVASGVTLSNAVAITGTNKATLAGGATNTDVSTVSGPITGTGGIDKTGSGTVVITGTNNNFTGATDISEGKLVVNGDISSSSKVTVEAGGTLGGSGKVGALEVASGGTLAVGNSPGTLIAGNTTWAGGASLAWEVDDSTGNQAPGGTTVFGQGTSWDFLDVTGTLNITATSGSKFIIDVISLLNGTNTGGAADGFAPGTDYSFAIATASGGLQIGGFGLGQGSYTDLAAFNAALSSIFDINTGSFANNLGSDALWSISTSSGGTSLLLSYSGSATAIPEPNSAALVLVGLGAALLKRRRRG